MICLLIGHYVCDVRDGDGTWKCYNDLVMNTVGGWEELNSARQRMGYLTFFVHEGGNVLRKAVKQCDI